MFLFNPDASCFYASQSVSLVIKFDESRHMDMISIFPSVVTFRVALPFDQVLQGLAMPPSLVSTDLFHFIL
jgi:hypothetical protein